LPLLSVLPALVVPLIPTVAPDMVRLSTAEVAVPVIVRVCVIT
jgi:hypothetical protein